MEIETLKILLTSEEVANDPNLKNELENLLNSNIYNVYVLPSSISFTTLQYLLNNNIDPQLILDRAIENHDENLLTLALTYKIDWSFITFNISSASLVEVKKFLEAGLSKAQLLEAALKIEAGDNRDQLLDLALEGEIDWDSVFLYYIQPVSVIEVEKFLAAGLNGIQLLAVVVRVEAGKERDQLLDLALKGNINWDYVLKYDIKYVALAEVEKLLESGLSPEMLLESVFYSLRFNNSFLSKKVSLDNHLKNLLDLAINKGADLDKAFSGFDEDALDFVQYTVTEESLPREILEFFNPDLKESSDRDASYIIVDENTIPTSDLIPSAAPTPEPTTLLTLSPEDMPIKSPTQDDLAVESIVTPTPLEAVLSNTELLKAAIQMEAGDNRDQLLDLALEDKISSNTDASCIIVDESIPTIELTTAPSEPIIFPTALSPKVVEIPESSNSVENDTSTEVIAGVIIDGVIILAAAAIYVRLYDLWPFNEIDLN